MQADAYDGYNALYEATWKPAPIKEAACWAHWRRKLFDHAKSGKAPIAVEAVRRMDEIFAWERTIVGKPPDERVAVRRKVIAPIAAELRAWLIEQRAKLSAKIDLSKDINYSLKQWEAFTRFLDDGRICMTNNAAERALRGIAVGRRNWTFAGSDAGGQRAAAVYSPVETCKLNNIDPQAWLADVLARLPDHPAQKVDELLPWNWKARQSAATPA